MEDKKEKKKRKQLKAPNGFGSVYKLPGRRRKPWCARVTDGWRCVDGIVIRDRRVIGYFEKESEAKEALLMHRISPVSPKANITLEELYEEWSGSKYEYITKSTIDCYKAGWKHLSKYRNVVFRELRTVHLQSVIDGCHKAKMSRSTLEKIKVVSKMLYDYAIQNDIINKNYADFINLPKAEQEEKQTFTDIEIQKLEKAEDQPWVDTILILIYTGMRINELLTLTRFGVDMESQTITGGLKTDAGKNRIIPIHPKILKHIKKWYYTGNDLLIHRNGKLITDKYYREKLYYPTLKHLKVRELNPHCCRHTFASMMARAGASTMSIQRIMGHSKYSFTADTYTHTDINNLVGEISKI